jgi:hypothetical protein
VDHICIFHP